MIRLILFGILGAFMTFLTMGILYGLIEGIATKVLTMEEFKNNFIVIGAIVLVCYWIVMTYLLILIQEVRNGRKMCKVQKAS